MPRHPLRLDPARRLSTAFPWSQPSLWAGVAAVVALFLFAWELPRHSSLSPAPDAARRGRDRELSPELTSNLERGQDFPLESSFTADPPPLQLDTLPTPITSPPASPAPDERTSLSRSFGIDALPLAQTEALPPSPSLELPSNRGRSPAAAPTPGLSPLAEALTRAHSVLPTAPAPPTAPEPPISSNPLAPPIAPPLSSAVDPFAQDSAIAPILPETPASIRPPSSLTDN